MISKLNYWINLQGIWEYPLILIFVQPFNRSSCLRCLMDRGITIMFQDSFSWIFHLAGTYKGEMYHICLIDHQLKEVYLRCLMKKSLFLFYAEQTRDALIIFKAFQKVEK